MTTQEDKQKEFLETKTLSILFRLALADLKECEALPDRYKINMNDWVIIKNGLCNVCLAGAAVVRRYGDTVSYAMLCNRDQSISRKMDALDSVRLGDVTGALMRLHDSYPENTWEEYEFLDRDLPRYGDPDWWSEMEKLLADLEKAKL